MPIFATLRLLRRWAQFFLLTCRCVFYLFAGVGDAPDAPGAVVGDVEGAVVACGDAYGAAPDLAVGGDEAGEEVLVLAGGVAVAHGDADDLVAAAVGAVPGAVLSGEGVTGVFGGELLAVVEEHLE